MTALKDLTTVLKLEVEDTPAGLVNLIQNPNGELGGWGWITPLSSSAMSGGSTALSYLRTVSGASYFTSELLPIAAGQYAAAAYAQRSAGNAYHKNRFEWYDANKALLSSSTQSSLIAPSATAVTNVAPIVAPASTAYMKLRIDLYTSGGVDPTGSHSFAFTNATVASAATSGALGTFRTNLVPNPSFESNVSGWNPYWYSGRETTLAQSATFAQSGTKSMSMTRPFTTGTLGASSAPIPVTGGADYIASLYSRAGSVARSFDLYLAWYTSAGVFISQNTATLTNATGAWTRHSVTATAPASAAYVRIEFATTAATTPAAEIHYVDAVLLEKSTVLGTYFDGSTTAGGGFTYAWVGTRTRTNLCTNPSAETNVTGWSSDDGLFSTATVARVTSPAGADRTACVSLTKLAGTGNGMVLRGSNPNRVTPASWTEEYVISASVRAAATPRSVSLGIAYLDSGGNLLGASSYGTGSDVVGSWTRYTSRITLNKSGMPSAVYVVPYITYGGTLATSEVHYVDAVTFEKTLSSGGGDYFDGAKAASAPYSFAWTGTADASTSTESGPLTSTATQSNLSYIPPVSYVNILGPTSEIKVVRPVFDVGTLNAIVREVALDPATATLLRPGRRVRLTALNSATAAFEVLFAGKADRAHVEYDLTRTDEKQATIELTAIDGTQDVANVNRAAGVGTIAELPYVLEGAGVPWNCDGSGNQVPGATVVSNVENASALDQVGLTRDSVSGYAWITKEGVVTAYTNRTLDYYGNGTATMDEDDYSNIGTSFDTDDCINEVMVNFLRFNPTTLETTEIPYGPFQDAASIKQWRAHQATFRVQGISEAAVSTFAAAILTANATPAFRVNSVTVPIRDTADMTELKALIDQYAKVNVINTAKAINVTHRVQTITHEITPPAYPGALAKWIMQLDFTGSASVAAPVPTPSPGADAQAADGVWISPTLGNGWTNFGGAFAPAQYMRKNGMVYLKGFIAGGTYGNPIFTLPAGYRPAATNVFSCISDRPTSGAASAGTAHTHLIPATAARVDVQASGVVQVAAAATGAYNNTFQSLSGISFPAEQ